MRCPTASAIMPADRARSSVGQSARFTSVRSRVRAPPRPPADKNGPCLCRGRLACLSVGGDGKRARSSPSRDCESPPPVAGAARPEGDRGQLVVVRAPHGETNRRLQTLADWGVPHESATFPQQVQGRRRRSILPKSPWPTPLATAGIPSGDTPQVAAEPARRLPRQWR